MAQKQIKFHTSIVDGQCRIDPHNQALKANWLAEQADGCLEVTIKRAVKAKTNKQLGAHFGLMIASAITQANNMGMDTSEFLKEMVHKTLPSGVGLTTNFLKEIMYALCPIYHEDKRITLSKASTVEASKHFDDCRNLLAAHGIYVDEPDVNWKDKENNNE